jgi:membrane fusion protein, multidrug efflux system
MRKTPIAALAAILLTAALSAPGLLGQDVAKPKGYPAVTKPSMDVITSFEHPGKVAEMLVDVGDEVKKGQLLARQDDSEEQAALAIDKSKAEDETTIEAQKKVAAEKQTAYERSIDAGKGVGPLELADAKLQAEVEQARVDLANVQHKQDQLKYDQTRMSVEKMKLFSPIDGVVAQRLLEEGETADGSNMKSLRIVQLDPLRIDVSVPILEARKLKEGSNAEVAFADKARTGKIVRLFPVGDASSGTILVRVEVPNPEKLTSGEKVFVNFNSEAAGVAAKQ